MASPEIKVLPSPLAVAREAADRIVRTAAESIIQSNRFTIGLSGGSTPKMLYELLASEPFRSQIDWSRVEIFFTDERAVSQDHPHSNFRMAQESLLSKVPIPGDSIYRIRGEIDPEAAAKEYGELLQEEFGDGGLDMVLLGMGEDGHTASIFPNSPASKETKHRIVANYLENSTTGKGWRISMTALFINKARQLLVLVTGAPKAAKLKEILEGPPDPHRLPIQLISPQHGQITWLIDTAAAGLVQQ